MLQMDLTGKLTKILSDNISLYEKWRQIIYLHPGHHWKECIDPFRLEKILPKYEWLRNLLQRDIYEHLKKNIVTIFQAEYYKQLCKEVILIASNVFVLKGICIVSVTSDN